MNFLTIVLFPSFLVLIDRNSEKKQGVVIKIQSTTIVGFN